MPLIKDGRYADDAFAAVADGAPLPGGPATVSLKRFQKERETLLARNTPLGVRLESDESPAALGADVRRLSLIVLEFPKFRDGRAFSWARLLRTRLGYRGEIRATGDFLFDQIAFMARVGIDTFEVPEAITPELFRRALGEMGFVYQPSADGRKTIGELRAGS
ncbi:MAG: DUF934 domain-containing protein [Alphaproteobacteria bacterium]|nr:DUF934 domain-containing protein [Alphaproteobacteria bacterium]